MITGGLVPTGLQLLAQHLNIAYLSLAGHLSWYKIYNERMVYPVPHFAIYVSVHAYSHIIFWMGIQVCEVNFGYSGFA